MDEIHAGDDTKIVLWGKPLPVEAILYILHIVYDLFITCLHNPPGMLHSKMQWWKLEHIVKHSHLDGHLKICLTQLNWLLATSY